MLLSISSHSFKLMKKYERGLLPHVDWLDNFTKSQIKKMTRVSCVV